jgi:hypothetical protein
MQGVPPSHFFVAYIIQRETEKWKGFFKMCDFLFFIRHFAQKQIRKIVAFSENHKCY